MSEGIHESGRQTDVAAPESTNAVGFVASEGNSEALARAILRAKDQGYEVFVTNDGESHGEALRFAETLGATVVELHADEPDDNALRQRLAIAAEKQGHSTLFVNLDVSERINYGRSEKLLEQDDFCVDAATHEPSKADSLLDNVLVAIPAYNESVAIGSVIHKTQRYVSEVLVVDDGSDDQTADIARRAGATVIEHEENRGKGTAVRTVLDYATEGDWKAVVLLDGDGQHYPEDIPEVVEPVLDGDADLVIGSRYVETASDDETPAYRRLGQRVLDVLTIGSGGATVSDSQSGFRALSANAATELDIRTDGMGVESEMLGDATKHELTVVEVPIDVRYEEVDGQTHNPLRHGVSVAVFVLQMIRDRNPLLFFGVPAVVLLVSGAGLMSYSAYLYQTYGAFHQWRFLISGFVLLLGTLSLFCGLVLSQVRNMVLRIDP
ncbi:Glycosyl transferase family 2 [Halomicrobium zhouii]|uniref:Glycosyl transferase family 2 n=1 Tax=Halomicrobium zhouii TaxID=767519 RepID=A0A1I6K8B5_9EURY|nr:glycosyltransferase family 2 protein [Halomicrobium zhouii]SFR87452.1 Glycosyl transferase family 2 [Halomicrobium zhouii]